MKKIILVIVFVIITGLAVRGFRGPAPGDVEPVAAVPASSRLSELLGADADAGFPLALEPRPFRFPADHGPHPEFRNEWWYATGNLDADGGRRFGFELTLFRFSLTPDARPDPSAWRTNQVYVGHLALTDVVAGEFHVAVRYSRGALGLAGAEAAPPRVWLEDWVMAALPDQDADREPPWRLTARDERLGIDLTLTPRKAPVANGEDGLSRKSSEPGNASYYYSLTRLAVTGAVEVDGSSHAVTGQAWLDREWGSSALARNQLGWDWFALQLDDETELMFYQLRLDDGARDPMSAGTWVTSDGVAHALGADDVTLEVLDQWDSPQGGRYPIRWRLVVPGIGLDVRIWPVLDAQELVTNVRYWEGAVDVEGTRGDNEVAGRGYVELTGYAD